jgi:hypothetical protein
LYCITITLSFSIHTVGKGAVTLKVLVTTKPSFSQIQFISCLTLARHLSKSIGGTGNTIR